MPDLATRFKYERPQDMDAERFENGPFRCMRCDMLWPLPWVDQDGKRFCARCADKPWGQTEARIVMAEEVAENAAWPMDTLDWGPSSSFLGVPSVTGISPVTLLLARSGAAKTITITGVNLTASDTWAASSGSITVTPTINSSTSVTLSVAAGSMTAGDYNLLFNGDVLTPAGIFKVR